jgi:hypothetical protein
LAFNKPPIIIVYSCNYFYLTFREGVRVRVGDRVKVRVGDRVRVRDRVRVWVSFTGHS